LLNWMIEKFIENLVVLGGEVAVPCNLQSAIAGFNAIERLIPRWVY